MHIERARQEDLNIVHSITCTTIKEIYPHYYPEGAVEFFLQHHSKNAIAEDIAADCVFLCYTHERHAVGTVTIRKNEICRLFVLPACQGKGYGKELLEFAESEIARLYHEIVLDASLPAKSLYIRRGYRAIEYHTIKTENHDYLCYDLMSKHL